MYIFPLVPRPSTSWRSTSPRLPPPIASSSPAGPTPSRSAAGGARCGDPDRGVTRRGDLGDLEICQLTDDFPMKHGDFS